MMKRMRIYGKINKEITFAFVWEGWVRSGCVGADAGNMWQGC